MKDDFDRLRADVEDLQLKQSNTAACCRTRAELDAQIRSGIADYLMAACVS